MRYIISICLSWLVIKPSFGQTNDLNPRSWFPLNEGSKWHYEYQDDFFGVINWINESVGDTTIEGNQWMHIVEVFCQPRIGTYCDSRDEYWYRFTPDDYLLRAVRSIVGFEIDTLLTTYPYSFFQLNNQTDTLRSFKTADPPELSPIIVRLDTNDVGMELDSTHLTLSVGRDIFFGGSFIYRIGNGSSLKGAIVNGVTYGDTTLISSFVLSYDTEPVNSNPSMDVALFPNPTNKGITARLTPHHSDTYTAEIVNLLGQIVWSDTQQGFLGASVLFSWPGDNTLAAGIYFMVIKNDKATIKVSPFNLVK